MLSSITRLAVMLLSTTLSSSKGIESGGVKKLAMGTNHSVDAGPLPSIHAEHNAVSKFMRLNKFRRFLSSHEKIDIVVIRLSRSGVVGYSRPCKNCIKRLMSYDVTINNIYYSDSDGSIKVEKFSTMYDSPLTDFSAGDKRKMNGICFNSKKKI